MTRSDRQRRRRQRRRHPAKRVFMLGGVLLVSALAMAALGLVGYVLAVADDAPNINHYRPRLPGQVTQVFASNGHALGYMSSDVLRSYLSQQQQPYYLREATVAIEDRRFWQHGGVDYEGLVRAAVKDLFEGGGIQGGSTLTMQLVKNIYLPTDIEHNLKYKIIQAKLANELQARHTKNWILTQYLNDVSYGTVDSQSAIGVGAASQMFFNKPVGRLDLAQMALLAGLPQAPTTYNPFNNHTAATERRGEVLAAMQTAGYITLAQEARANASPLQVVPNSSFDKYQQPYVMNYVQRQLVQDLGQATVDRGGLKVYTTISLADQASAKTAILAHEGERGDPAASLISINPANGNILALQNSTRYGNGPGETEFNYAVQAERQTGSSFKPFVLMALIKDFDGNPNDTYYDSEPLAAGWLPGYPTYAVHNAEAGGMGNISVTLATTDSVNAVYAQLGVDVGMDNVDAMAHAMGVTAPLYGYPSEAIGGLRIGVSALQMADAYATLANGGDHIAPTIISKVILPNGKTERFGDPTPTNVFSQGQAYAATQVLKSVVQYGTGTAADYGCPAAGKTGTTSNYTDAWFVGYTPKLSTAVWVGYPKADTYMTDVNGLGPGYGGTLAAPIWHDFMEKASDGFCGDFAAPDQYWYGTEYFGKHSSLAPVAPTTTTGTSTSTTATNTTTTGTGGSSSKKAPATQTPTTILTAPPAANGGNGT